MRITRVRWAPYCIAFREPYRTSLGTLTQREGLLLQLVADDGRTGLGEADPTPEALGAARALERALAQIAPGLLARDVADIHPPTFAPECAPEVAAAVRAAIDSAVCDLLAQASGVSVARFLEPAAANTVAVNALVTLSANPSEVTRAAVTDGFATIKLKVGLPSLDADWRNVAAVRAAIGSGIKLRLDPNGAWNVAQAAMAINALAEYDIEYVEQPIPPGDIEALRRLQAAVDVPIAADEDVTDLEAARRILETGAARVLVLKPQRLGGLRPCLRVIEAARQAGAICVVTTSIEAGVGTAACLHLAAALPPGSPACGLATASLLISELTAPSLPVENGAMRVPPGPGLGVRLDENAPAPYRGPWREVS